MFVWVGNIEQRINSKVVRLVVMAWLCISEINADFAKLLLMGTGSRDPIAPLKVTPDHPPSILILTSMSPEGSQ